MTTHSAAPRHGHGHRKPTAAFIITTGRTGSSILVQILTSLNSTLFVGEHLWHEMLNPLADMLEGRGVQALVHHIDRLKVVYNATRPSLSRKPGHPFFAPYPMFTADHLEDMRRHASAEHTSLSNFLRATFPKRGASLVGGKLLTREFSWAFIRRAIVRLEPFQSVRFIFLTRDADAVRKSMRRNGYCPNSHGENVCALVDGLFAGYRKLAARLPNTTRLVTYEEMVTSSNAFMSLFAWLGVNATAADVASQLRQVRASYGNWRVGDG